MRLMPKKLFSTQRPLLREGLVPLQVWPHALVALKLWEQDGGIE